MEEVAAMARHLPYESATWQAFTTERHREAAAPPPVAKADGATADAFFDQLEADRMTKAPPRR